MIKPLDIGNRLPWESEVICSSSPEENLPSLSIVIPIFNAGRYLERTLRSLLCNDLAGVELIVQDSESTDNTYEILEHYREMFDQLHIESDSGQSDAINRGLSRSSGDICFWLNGDDVLLPGALQKVREEFFKVPDIEWLVADACMVEEDLSIIRHFEFSAEDLRFEVLLNYAKNHLIQPSVFFSRHAWDTCGPLDTDNHFSMDADLFLSMSKRYVPHHLNLIAAFSVYHDECKTKKSRVESITSLALVQAKHGGLTEARNTLDLLPELFSNAASAATQSESLTEPNPSFLREKLKALENLVEEKRKLCISGKAEVT